MVPKAHNLHLEPSPEVPGGHFSHVSDPLYQPRPSLHGGGDVTTHCEISDAPKDEVFPDGQSAQAVSSSTPPVLFPKVPGGHLNSQEVLPKIGLKDPFSHGLQSLKVLLPTL